jgi:hypothetical protein
LPVSKNLDFDCYTCRQLQVLGSKYLTTDHGVRRVQIQILQHGKQRPQEHRLGTIQLFRRLGDRWKTAFRAIDIKPEDHEQEALHGAVEELLVAHAAIPFEAQS